MNWNTKITLRQALQIQADQLDHYCKNSPYGDAVRAEIAERTEVKGLYLDSELPVHVVNRFVPRGGSIEAAIERAKEKRQFDVGNEPKNRGRSVLSL